MMHSPHGKSGWHGSGCHGKGKEGEGSSHGRSGFHHGHPHGKILGTTVVGERGQVVIPREARDEVGVESGDRFVVFGDKNKDCIMLVKADVFNHFAEVFMNKSKKLEKMAQEIWEATQSDFAEDETENDTKVQTNSDAGKKSESQSCSSSDAPEAGADGTSDQDKSAQ